MINARLALLRSLKSYEQLASLQEHGEINEEKKRKQQQPTRNGQLAKWR